MKSAKSAFGVSVATAMILVQGLAFADEPPAGVPQEYMDAGETIIDVAYTMSEPFYNGDYYVSSTRPSSTFCMVQTTNEDYDKDGNVKKVTVTSYDMSKVDPASIQPDQLGGIKFWSYDQEAVFKMEVVEGDDFGSPITMIPGDNIDVEDEETEVAPMIAAFKYLAEYCAPKPEPTELPE